MNFYFIFVYFILLKLTKELLILPIDVDVVFESFHCSLESQSSGQQDEHHEVWEQSCEPNDLQRKGFQ